MAGATINLSKSASSGSYIIGKIVWSSVVNNDANNSDVTASLYIRKDSTAMILTIPTEGTWSYSLTVNGSTVSGTVSKSVLSDWVLIATKSVNDISHNADGTKSITISGSVTAPTGTTLAGHTTSGSGTATFDTVPRATTIDSLTCNSEYLNGKITYKYTPQTANYYNRVNITLNISGTLTAVKTINLGKKTATQQTTSVTLSADELAIIYNKLPSTRAGTLRFTLRTYKNSDYTSQIGDADQKEVTLNIPDNSTTKPTVTMALTPVSSLGSGFAGLYIQGKTKVKATLSATGKNNATIKSYKMTADGTTYDSDDAYTSAYLAHEGSISVVGYATDSRNITGSISKSITVIPYSKPQIQAVSGESEVIASRCDSSGSIKDNGTYLKIKAKRSYSKVMSSSTQKNFCQIRYRYKADGGSYSSWTTILAKNSLSSDEIVTGALLGGALAIDKSYIVQVQAIDDIGEYATTTISVPTDKVYMHEAASMNSLGIGKYAEDPNTVDIAEEIAVRVRGDLIVGERTISDTGWISLGISSEVAESALNAGRSGKGCFYRVIDGNHVYVAFNCSFQYENAAITIGASKIPAPYNPARNMYAFNPTNGRGIARVFVNSTGDVRIDYVQNMASAETTSSVKVNWIDGYIDYWV